MLLRPIQKWGCLLKTKKSDAELKKIIIEVLKKTRIRNNDILAEAKSYEKLTGSIKSSKLLQAIN